MSNILCKIFNHKYRLWKEITPTIREVRCKRCGEFFGMNDNTKSILPMCQELYILHRDLKQDNETFQSTK